MNSGLFVSTKAFLPSWDPQESRSSATRVNGGYQWYSIEKKPVALEPDQEPNVGKILNPFDGANAYNSHLVIGKTPDDKPFLSIHQPSNFAVVGRRSNGHAISISPDSKRLSPMQQELLTTYLTAPPHFTHGPVTNNLWETVMEEASSLSQGNMFKTMFEKLKKMNKHLRSYAESHIESPLVENAFAGKARLKSNQDAAFFVNYFKQVAAANNSQLVNFHSIDGTRTNDKKSWMDRIICNWLFKNPESKLVQEAKPGEIIASFSRNANISELKPARLMHFI